GTSTGPVAVGTFQDGNTLAQTGDFTAGDYSVSINWGDGTAATSGTVVGNPDGSFTVQGSHTWTTAGSYTVSTTVTDEGGQSTTFSSTATVSGAWTVIGSQTLAPSNDPDREFLLSLGEANVDLNQGGLRLAHDLNFDVSPGSGAGGNPALVYNSAT